MQRIRPDYYDRFTCIADRCTITCCQEWKIAVDTDTNRKWKKVCPPDTVKEQKKNLSAYTTKKEGLRVIKLDNDHRCPFLADNKLCRLVYAYGDKILSETCTTFPREVHRFSDHEEETLMPCCPAVIDLWDSEELLHFPVFNPAEDSAGVSDNQHIAAATNTAALTSDHTFTDSFLFKIRTKCIEQIYDTSVPLESILLGLFYILHELLHKQDEGHSLTDELLDDYFSSRTVKQLRDAISEIELPSFDTIMECNELLQDLAVNYKKEGLYLSYLNPVLNLAENLSEAFDFEDELLLHWENFQKDLLSHDFLLRNFMANELYSDLLMPGATLKDMLIQMQWIAMEYAVIRHSLFLKWLLNSDSTTVALPYEAVRDYLVVVTRMTGYEEEDIYEYLKNSFESLIWDWGYFALITGKN